MSLIRQERDAVTTTAADKAQNAAVAAAASFAGCLASFGGVRHFLELAETSASAAREAMILLERDRAGIEAAFHSVQIEHAAEVARIAAQFAEQFATECEQYRQACVEQATTAKLSARQAIEAAEKAPCPIPASLAAESAELIATNSLIGVGDKSKASQEASTRARMTASEH